MDPNSRLLMLGAGGITPPGQQEYTTPGTYSWVAPPGVTSVSVVVVGGGGGGSSNHDGNGGGGGSLGYKNNISVSPGSSYTVVVGASGISPGASGGAGGAGGQSYFISTGTVQANGGAGGPASNAGPTANDGGYVGDGGGNGGYGTTTRGGGCGAGGYTGRGGLAAYTNQSPTAPDTDSGAGSAGVAVDNVSCVGGGGVGIYGKGGTGANPTYDSAWGYTQWTYSTSNANSFIASQGGKGGSGGGNPILIELYNGSLYPMATTGGVYGGGGSSSFNSSGLKGGDGGGGAVRIIWGPNRSFPSTNTGNV